MLDSNVLVLNRLFQAIQVTSVRKAFCLLYKGHVKVVQPDYTTYSWENWQDIPIQPQDDVILTPRITIKVPRVILLLHYDQLPPQEVRFTRKNIYLRDKSKCQYCGRRAPTKELNLDHIIPISRGGRSTWENVVCCCLPCNSRKGNRLPHQVGMKLIKEPKKPRWHPLVKLSFTSGRYEVWRNFLDLAYWNVELSE